MLRKWRSLCLAGCAVVLVLASNLYLLQPRERITREAYDGIRLGMTVAEVAKLLVQPPGYPPGYQRARWLIGAFDGPALTEGDLKGPFEGYLGGSLPCDELSWQGRYASITVKFDQTERITGKRFQPEHIERSNLTWWDLFLTKLGR